MVTVRVAVGVEELWVEMALSHVRFFAIKARRMDFHCLRHVTLVVVQRKE